MTLLPAIFGIEAGPLNTAVQLTLLAVVVVWLALVWYTFADARRRLDDQLLIGSSVLASLIFPFLGTIVYMIVRPPEYLEDVRERELEMEAAQARLVTLDYQLCPHCDAPAGRDFLRCPHCLRKLRDTCSGCSRPLDPDWMICPYCETEIPGVTPQRRRRRRRSGESEPPPGYGEYGESESAPAPDGTAAVSESQLAYPDPAPVSESPDGYARSSLAPETPAAIDGDTVIAPAPDATFEDVAWSREGREGAADPPDQH